MPRSQPLLRVAFESPEAFESEYHANLANAGVFVATDAALSLRDTVRVEIALEFCKRSVKLEGEVVHRVDAEMAAAGGTEGVAIQFAAAVNEVRDRLAPLVEASGSFQRDPRDAGQRDSPRVPARVPVFVETEDGPVEGLSRNLSLSGVLVSVPGTDIPVGSEVDLSLVHPTNGRAMDVRARVMRHVQTAGEVTGLGMRFHPPAGPVAAEFRAFVEGIQSAEHSRRLGGIAGSIAELGPQNLLHMFGTSAPEGTLSLVYGDLEGVVGFQGGLLRFARVGTTSGMKALTRLMGLREGAFEFHASLEQVEASDAPLPLEAAVLEAVRLLDELERIDLSRFPFDAKLAVVGAAAAAEADLCKVEAAVLDLAGAGFDVQRVIEVIPEPDPEIYGALEALLDRGAIALERPC